MGFRFRSNDERSYFLAHFGVTANTNIRARCVFVAVVVVDSKKSRPVIKFNLNFKSDFFDTSFRSFRSDNSTMKIIFFNCAIYTCKYVSILLNADIA